MRCRFKLFLLPKHVYIIFECNNFIIIISKVIVFLPINTTVFNIIIICYYITIFYDCHRFIILRTYLYPLKRNHVLWFKSLNSLYAVKKALTRLLVKITFRPHMHTLHPQPFQDSLQLTLIPTMAYFVYTTCKF